MPEDRALEIDGQALRDLVAAATDRLVAFLAALPTAPAADTAGSAEAARALREPLPETGRPVADALEHIFDRVLPKGLNTAGPGYLAYIPGGGLPESAIADLIAGITNRFVGVFAAGPGVAALESNVVRWLADIVGYPPGASGILTSGGSLATFSALVAARRDRLGESFLSGTLYASQETHHSLSKAASLAGFPESAVRAVPTDGAYRMRVDLLAGLIAEDRRAGRTPFLVVGNAGTTNTGAVDDLSALADISSAERLWFHVDGAYGGFFALTERGRLRLAGIERADSIVLDPHKGLFLPYGTGALLVRDSAALRRAHGLTAAYLPSMQDDPDLVDYTLLSPELSRDWRGLRVWLPIALHGIGVFRRNLDEKLDLAQWAATELDATPGIEILALPQLSILAFRAKPPGLDDDALNHLNRTFLERINARQRVHLTATMLGPHFAIRICVLSFRTHEERMRLGLEDIRLALAETLAER